jgi:SOS response regulatory protein OraA/RecX
MNSDTPEEKVLAQRAARLLARYEHSRKQLREKLLHPAKGEPPDSALADAVLDRLESCDALSDLRFARQKARELALYKHYAPRRIAAELSARGVDAETAQAEAAVYDEEAQLRACLAKQPCDLSQTRDRARLFRLGYSSAVLRRVCRDAADRTEDFP